MCESNPSIRPVANTYHWGNVLGESYRLIGVETKLHPSLRRGGIRLNQGSGSERADVNREKVAHPKSYRRHNAEDDPGLNLQTTPNSSRSAWKGATGIRTQ